MKLKLSILILKIIGLFKEFTTKYGCQIIFPSRCPYPVFKNILDYTKFVGKECKKFGIDAKQKILKLSNSPFINDSVNLRL